jgi:hypothetical protein
MTFKLTQFWVRQLSGKPVDLTPPDSEFDAPRIHIENYELFFIANSRRKQCFPYPVRSGLPFNECPELGHRSVWAKQSAELPVGLCCANGFSRRHPRPFE